MVDDPAIAVAKDKLEWLRGALRDMGSVAVAFSSGVDSTLLLQVAHEELGDRVLAVTASSCTFPERERVEARAFCRERGIRQVEFASEEFDIEGFRQNPPNRCYLCKRELFGKVAAIAAEHGMAVVADGSNTDDEGDYRPGMQALRELGIRSPLREAGLSKSEIRLLSRELGLPTWNKQSFACLSSRFAYGETIAEDALRRVDRAEQLLLDEGFTQVRVRVHGDMARIEVEPSQVGRLVDDELRVRVHASLRAMGFSYVSVDLGGYRSGSMNDTLPEGGR